jgi:hypothetical protein
VVHGLAALEAAGMGKFLNSPKVANGIGFLHTANGNRVSQRLSNTFRTGASKVIHNPRVGKKQVVAHESTETTLAERLQAAMSLRGIPTNPNKIETATGITRQTLYAVRDGKTQKLLWETCVKLAAYLGVRPEWLNDGELPMHPVPKLEDDDEIQLIEHYRHLSPSHQKDIRAIAERWAEEDDPHPSKTRPFSTNPRIRKQ